MWNLATMTDIVPTDPGALVPAGDEWERIVGKAADQAARQNVFAEALAYKADNTLRAYKANLQTFCDEYLPAANIQRDVDAMMTDPAQWAFLTYGIVKGFREWMLQQGYALGTVTHKLSTVKRFAKLATEARVIDHDTADEISTVKGPPSGKQGKRLNERREEAGIPRRMSKKKQETLLLTQPEIYKMLTEHPETPQGRRDRVMVCLGLEHGMRASELATLQVEDIDMTAGTIRIYRHKTGLEQFDHIQGNSLLALDAYFAEGDAPDSGPLLRGSRKGGKLTHRGMSSSRISTRINEVARRILKRDDITAHDLRASFATWAARSGSDIFAIRDAGGWKTTAMVEHYIKAAGLGEKANGRIKLS